MTRHPIDQAPGTPLFTGLVVSRPRSFPVSRRAGVLAVATLLHLSVLVAWLVAPFVALELMEPPRAQFDLVFRPSRLPASGGGAAAGPHHQGGPGPRAVRPRPPAPASTPRPAALLPPEEEMPGITPAITGNGAGGDLGGPLDGRGGGGDGSGTRTGPGNCADCPPGPGGDGDSGVALEWDPRITQPVLIPSTRNLPRYPAIARRAKIQATVVLRIVVDDTGRVGAIEVLKSPDPRWGFDLEAIEAVKQWRYHPALIGGRPVASYVRVLVEFNLVD